VEGGRGRERAYLDLWSGGEENRSPKRLSPEPRANGAGGVGEEGARGVQDGDAKRMRGEKHLEASTHGCTAARERMGTNDSRSNGQENFADVDACGSRFSFCFHNKEMCASRDSCYHQRWKTSSWRCMSGVHTAEQ
jgi:hypothetical protein